MDPHPGRLDHNAAVVRRAIGIGAPRLNWFLETSPAKICGRGHLRDVSSVGLAAVLIHIDRKFLLKLRIILNDLDDLVVLLRIQTLVLHGSHFR